MLTLKCQCLPKDSVTFTHEPEERGRAKPLAVVVRENGTEATVILAPEQARHLARELLRKYGNSEDTPKWEGCL